MAKRLGKFELPNRLIKEEETVQKEINVYEISQIEHLIKRVNNV